MKNSYKIRYPNSLEAIKNYDTKILREEFLISNLMQSWKINLTYTHYNR